jgi:hypothetical protein
MRGVMDWIFNWSGGAYVGLSTSTVLFLAVAESYKGGWKAPDWFVGNVGIYMVILGLFWLGKPAKDVSEGIKGKLIGNGKKE